MQEHSLRQAVNAGTRPCFHPCARTSEAKVQERRSKGHLKPLSVNLVGVLTRWGACQLAILQLIQRLELLVVFVQGRRPAPSTVHRSGKERCVSSRGRHAVGGTIQATPLARAVSLETWMPSQPSFPKAHQRQNLAALPCKQAPARTRRWHTGARHTTHATAS